VFKEAIQTDEQVSKALESGRLMVWETFFVREKRPWMGIELVVPII